jgi:hypothetical protein
MLQGVVIWHDAHTHEYHYYRDNCRKIKKFVYFACKHSDGIV